MNPTENIASGLAQDASKAVEPSGITVRFNAKHNGVEMVLMNPPFSNGDDIKHIKHAHKFLAEGGRLVAICGSGPKQRAFAAGEGANWIALPEGSFKSSGTGVNAAIIILES